MLQELHTQDALGTDDTQSAVQEEEEALAAW
jgi:hypothetical protein